MDKEQSKEAANEDGVQPVNDRLSRRIERTQKISMPNGKEAEKYWMRPMAPAEQIARGVVSPDVIAQQQEGVEHEMADGDFILEPLEQEEEIRSVPEDLESDPTASAIPSCPPETYQAYLVRQQGEKFQGDICEQKIDALPAGDLLIRVDYSSLNYKDALVATGYPGIAKSYPQVPGIDAAGTVVRSASQGFREGDPVIVSGNGLGVSVPGGFGEYIRVPMNWAVPLPQGLSPRESMAYGTAGFTAGVCVEKLTQNGLRPQHGRILVTGATGGVGSFAVSILAAAGFTVTAATGKLAKTKFLKELGAADVIDRNQLLENAERALNHATWAGAVDTVGGDTLAGVLRQMQYGGAVSCCGMVAGTDLNTSVYPFILRGVSLFGIDAANCSRAVRIKIWQRLAEDWKLPNLEELIHCCGLAQLPTEIETMLNGEHVGRTIIQLRD